MKRQFLNITNKRKPVLYPYTIHGHTLETVENTKYLGLHLQRQLNWNTHINKVVSKVNTTSVFIQSTLRQSPEHIKEQAYKSLVRSIQEYAATVWDPHIQTNIRRIEMVQRRAARFVIR